MKRYVRFLNGTAALSVLALGGAALAAPPEAGSVIGNQAVATYTNNAGDTITVTSNKVETVVQQVAGVTLTADNNETLAPGGKAFLPHVVTNEGNGPDSFSLLSVERNSGALDTTLAPRSRGLNQITVPTADGGTQTFAVVPTQTMAPELAAKYPSIRTYFGVATDGSDARISLTVSERGVDASIFENDRRTVIRPTFARSATHVVFDAADLPPVDFFEPEIPPIPAIGGSPRGPVGPFTTGGSVKVYRFAVPVTGEYSDNHGGTVPLVLAAVVSRVAEINAVWEIDLALRLELVADNNLLIYLDKDTDPWSDGCSFDNLDFALIQSTVDGIIGAANYDLGHLFLANLCGGAVGGLVCTSGKARSATGVNARLGILLHEAGHSLGAGHTWNSIACFALVPGNYEAAHAYEPGSGSTILSYIGICDADNLGTESERLLQYHSHSFDQVRNYVENGSGNTCGTSDTSVSNSAPVPDAGADVTLPISTPFVLTASVTDAEGDPLLYAWEEYDLPPNPAAPSSGVVPFFQVFARQSDPARTFPPIENVVSGIPLLGDEVPSTAEVLNMRIHVWDQHPGAPGVAYDLVQLTFSDAAGPFAVTAPDGGETLTPSATTTVAWNVASTDQPPVSCSVVDIDLSTDGGFTYPTSLAVSTLNDGSEMIMLPDVVSSDARIRVRCAERDDHFFFDISDASFVIWPSFPPCSATDLEVKTLADSGACSLRDSVAQAATGSTITFHPTVISGFEIRLGSQIVVDKNLTIDGGASGMGIVSDGTERVFAVTAGTVEFFDLTISDGEAGAGYGGGIHISGGASLELNHCTVS
ncbi:MAG: reprolysin-like metallopeptidase, partial [bacterium]